MEKLSKKPRVAIGNASPAMGLFADEVTMCCSYHILGVACSFTRMSMLVFIVQNLKFATISKTTKHNKTICSQDTLHFFYYYYFNIIFYYFPVSETNSRNLAMLKFCNLLTKSKFPEFVCISPLALPQFCSLVFLHWCEMF